MNYIYSSINEFLDLAESKPLKSNYLEGSNEQATNRDSLDFEQALNWIKNGRDLEIFELTKILNSELTQNNVFDFQTQNSVSGAMVNIGEYLIGNPENMINYIFEEKPKISKFLTININLAISYKIKNRTIMTAGKKILEAIMELEFSGYQTEIFCNCRTEDKGKRKNNEYFFSIKTKNFGEFLNPNTFFSCVSTDFIRRFYFRFCERILTGESMNHCRNYGKPLVYPNEFSLSKIINENLTVDQIVSQILELNK